MSIRCRVLVLTSLVVAGSLVTSAQPKRPGLMGDLLADITEVESKVVGLAKAMPDASYAWRPMPGVRSVGEAFIHVAADNYFFPIALGVPAPAGTGIVATDYKTVEAYEKRARTRAEIIAEVEKSFALMKKTMAETTDAKMETTVKIFGQESTVRGTWVGAVTHLHEHLGQLIAYARSNKVVPPWSK